MEKIICLISLVFIQLLGFTQKVEVNSFVDKNSVSVNEIITFTITTNSNCQIYTPNFNGLQVVQGPFRSSSSRIVDVNGQRSIEQELKFTYRLRAPKVDNYKISSVRLVCGGKEYSTKAISIKVVEGNSSQTNPQTKIPQNNADFFMRLYSNKSTVYQGEPFILSLKIFSKGQPQNIESLEIGDSKGLLRKDLNPNKSTFNSELEVINGIRYYTTTIRTELCFAQNSGKIDINPASISAIFSRGFFNQYRRKANSNKLTINVKPLPGGAPKNFNGLVGSFSLDHSISRNKLKPGEAIDMQIKISGRGNLNTFDDPDIAFPNDFEQFDPEIDNNVSYKSSGISGSIAYNYVLIPTFYGNYTIPAYSFSYFDIDSKAYKSLSTGDITIEVEKTANSEPGNTVVNQGQKEIEIEETDIHHLINAESDFEYNDFVIDKIWYYGLLSMPFILVWFVLKKRKQSQSETYLRNTATKQSLLAAKKSLIQARTLAGNNKNNEAIQSISSALKTFLKQKNNLSNLELNLSDLLQLLGKKGWADIEMEQFKLAWNNIEMYQYAPISAEKLDDLIADIEKLIERIASDK